MGEHGNPSFLFSGEESRSLPLHPSVSDQDLPFLFGDDSGAGSEEGFDLPEEPVRRGPHRSSGSKRSRAAEVHNLSEKRRRSRINEKMKALQNLIPNSNKTDKASMLDEAIEYLKQLQLQVQTLSMRNGLTSLPMYLPGSLPPLQASQLCSSLGDSMSAMSVGALGFVPLNKDHLSLNSFHLMTESTSTRPSVVVPSTNISALDTTFSLEPCQSRHQHFQYQVPHQELFTEDMELQQQFDSPRTTKTLTEIAMKTMDIAGSLHFKDQTSSALDQNDALDTVLPKDLPDNNARCPQTFDGLQSGRSFTPNNVNVELID